MNTNPNEFDKQPIVADEEWFARNHPILVGILGDNLAEPQVTVKTVENNGSVESHHEPQELSPEPIPTLNEEAFYGIAGDFAKEAAKDSEADPFAILMQCLAYFAIAAGRKRFYKIGFTAHHPRIFVVLVGKSSKARKGTSWEPVKALFKRLKELGTDVPEWRPGPFSSGEGIIYAIRDPSEIDPDTNKSKDPGVEDKRLLVSTSEFAGGLKAMKREGNILSTVIRAFFDGDDIAPLIKNNPIRATAPHVGVVGHITKQELTKELQHVDVFNGFGNRFLWPFVSRPKLVAFPKAIEEARFYQLAQKFKAALTFAQQPGEIVFSEGLNKIWAKVYEKLQHEKPGIAGVLTNRSEVQVIRIALIFALLDQSSVIDIPHMRASLSVWNYCMCSVFYIFGVELDDASSRIISALKSGPHSQTAISKLFNRHLSSDKLRQKLSDMEADGTIKRELEKIPGGRTKTIWRLTERGQANYAS